MQHPPPTCRPLLLALLVGILLCVEALSFYGATPSTSPPDHLPHLTPLYWIVFCLLYPVFISVLATRTYTLGALAFSWRRPWLILANSGPSSPLPHICQGSCSYWSAVAPGGEAGGPTAAHASPSSSSPPPTTSGTCLHWSRWSPSTRGEPTRPSASPTPPPTSSSS